MVATITSQDDLRTRKKIAAMRRVQEAALELFEERGFDAVTIEAIAARAEVGPATVYRNFGEKERLLLWDEYDPMLLQALDQELPRGRLLDAVQRALAASVAKVYREDKQRILRRARLIRKIPSVQKVAALDLAALRGAIAAALLQHKRANDKLAARVLAGAITAALEAGIDRWLDGGGKEPLVRSLEAAFKRLGELK